MKSLRRIGVMFLISTLGCLVLNGRTVESGLGGVSLTFNTTSESNYIKLNQTKHEGRLKLVVSYEVVLDDQQLQTHDDLVLQISRNSTSCEQELALFLDGDEYCGEKTKVFKNVGPEVRLFHLLPNQMYLLRWQLVEEGDTERPVNERMSWALKRSPQGKPLMPPKALIDSFTAVGEKRILFWRKRPSLMMGGNESSYQLHCFNTKNNKSFVSVSVPATSTTYTIDAPKRGLVLECRIWSVNAAGRSDEHTAIIIPPSRNLIPLQRQHAIQQVLTEAGRYDVRWSIVGWMDEAAVAGGFYTIHWCLDAFDEQLKRRHWFSDCSSYGSKQVGGGNNFLADPLVTNSKHRANFGISFTKNNLKESTGIIWNACPLLLVEDDPPEFKLNAVENYGAKTITLSWSLGTCSGFSLFVDRYNLKYCRVNDRIEGQKMHKMNSENCIGETFMTSSLYHTFGKGLVPESWYKIELEYESNSQTTKIDRKFHYRGIEKSPEDNESKYKWVILAFIIVSCFYVVSILVDRHARRAEVLPEHAHSNPSPAQVLTRPKAA